MPVKNWIQGGLLLWLLACAFHGAIGVGVYSRSEASFAVTNLTSDPFDYTVTDVRAQILQPDGSTVSLPAFYDGGTTWRVRHTPGMAGLYQVTGVTLNGQPLSVGNLQPSSWTVAGWPNSRGFVAVDPANTNHFITTDSHRYYPLGQDVAWDTTATTNVVSIMTKLGATHENWSRVWMDHWDGKNLDWPKVGGNFGTLSLAVAQKWDAIVFAAEQSGVALQMTLQHHGQYSSSVDSNWGQNPYNAANGGFLSDATQFFTNATAKALTKRKLRYAVARWGYSPAIMGWELFNEVQYTDAALAGQWANIGAWHNEMAQFIRLQDAYHHLITTSSDLNEPIWNQCDYYQHHDYPADLISALRDPAGVPAGQPVKPIFGGECGMDSTPYLGFHAPLWAGLMAGQSGAAQQWYWDQVDADNAYPLFRSAADFVRMAGLSEQDALARAAPHVSCPVSSSLVFAPGGGWGTATQDTFTVGDNAPNGIGTLPSYLQGNYHRSMTPNGFTFLVNYPPGGGSFSAQVLTIAASGAGLTILVDGLTASSVAWPAPGSDLNTNFTLSANITAGQHSIKLWNPGQDWVNLGNLTFNPYTPILGAYQLGNTNFAALWIWHRTNIYNPNATLAVSGSLVLAGLQSGTYAGAWWDTFAGEALSNFTFTVTDTNGVTLSIPPVLRSVAFYAGPPPQATVVPPALNQILTTNSPALALPLVITNAGGLPLAYSICVTGVSPVAYSALNSTQTGGPVFAWTDISAIGRELTTNFTALTTKSSRDEGIAGPIDIGFNFPFFSGSQVPGLFNKLFISPNGFVTFTPFAGDTSTNASLPNVLAPSNCIAFFWKDMVLNAAAHVYCATDSIAGAFTLQFQNVSIKGTSTNVSCQLILKTSGEILMQYKTVGISNACTVGIQNAAADQGLQVAFNQNYLNSGFAISLKPASWLDVSANSDLVPRWKAEHLTLALSPEGKPEGIYSATLLLVTADPALPLTVLPVSLTVLDPIDAWRLNQFGTWTNAGLAADAADPDHDGLVNLIEYALGLNPNSPDPNPVTFSISAGHLKVQYKRPHPAPIDVACTAETAGDLSSVSWNSGPLYLSQTSSINGDGTETVTVTDLADLSTAPAHYLRLRFSRQ